MMILDVISYSKSNKQTSILILLDFKKDFDSIVWEYIWQGLKFFHPNISAGLEHYIKIQSQEITVSYHMKLICKRALDRATNISSFFTLL